MSVCVRPAQRDDLPAILDIYNHAVLNTTASYEYEPTTLEKRTQWFEDHQQSGLPIIVAVDEAGCVVGWGSLSKFRERIGYRFTVEHSLYVAPDQQRRGIGRLMLLDLIDRARALGKHSMIAVVDGNSAASLGLHRAQGFEQVGHIREIGYKFDRWLDVVLLQLMLDPV